MENVQISYGTAQTSNVSILSERWEMRISTRRDLTNLCVSQPHSPTPIANLPSAHLLVRVL